MSEFDQVNEILERWHKLRANGQDVPQEELCREDPELLLKGHTGLITKVVISADAKLALSSAYQPVHDVGEFRLWDDITWRELRAIKENGGMLSMDISADGKLIATCAGQTSFQRAKTPSLSVIKIWDLKTGALLRTLKGNRKFDAKMAMSADGKRLVTGTIDIIDRESSKDRESYTYLPGEVMVWDVEAGRLLHSLDDHPGPIFRLAISADRRRIVTVSAKAQPDDNNPLFKFVYPKLKVWDAISGKELARDKLDTLAIGAVAINADGTWIVFAVRRMESAAKP